MREAVVAEVAADHDDDHLVHWSLPVAVLWPNNQNRIHNVIWQLIEMEEIVAAAAAGSVEVEGAKRGKAAIGDGGRADHERLALEWMRDEAWEAERRTTEVRGRPLPNTINLRAHGESDRARNLL